MSAVVFGVIMFAATIALCGLVDVAGWWWDRRTARTRTTRKVER